MKKRYSLFPGAAVFGLAAAPARGAASPFYMGGDVSLIPFIESRGGTYRDGGQFRPPEQILVNHGNNLFRLRIFVNPNTSYEATNGAIQNEAYTIALAQRLKATGAKILLDFHYSDTWADPGNQAKPAAWASQNWATLQTTVRNYTRDTLINFRNAGVMPEMVQVGNEVTNGMLYGTTVVPPNGGHVVYTGANQTASWQNFGTLLNAGIAGVRDVDAQTPGQHTDIALHVDGGNVVGRAQYYFNQITNVAGVPASSFDVMGMSFYGTTTTDVSTLQTNLTYLANNYTKKVMVLEVNKRWKGTNSGSWPSTPTGQSDFFLAVRDVVRNLPNDRGAGVVWWYPESIQIPGTFMWQSGGVALFDDDTDGAGSDGHDALPALNLFALTTPTWNADASGNWYNAMNWSGGVPMFTENPATLGPVITAPRTVTLNGSRTIKSLTFDSPHGYTIDGNALVIDGPGSTSASISVANGSHLISSQLSLADSTPITVTPAGSTLTLSNIVATPGSVLTKNGAGTLAVNNLRAGTLMLNAGTVRVLPDSSAAGTSKLAILSVAPAARLDITSNKLIVSANPITPIGIWNNSAYTGMTGLIASGRSGGTWTGNGIITSQPDAQSGLTSIAVARASDIGISTTAVWSGQTVSSTDTLVMYTYGGDANLDGKINIDDYVRIDQGLANGYTGWSNGDFNYDGKVNIDDYTTVIDSNIGNQILGTFPTTGGIETITAIPEPSAAALILAIGLPLRGRRRRNA